MCSNSNLISSVSESCLDVVHKFVNFLDTVNHKYPAQLSGKAATQESDDDSDTEEDKYKKEDKFATRISDLSRKICWLTGSLAHNLVEVKKPEEIKADIAQKEKEKEKMARLLMDSKLLSGGIENRHMNFFSQKTKVQMIDILTISNDNTLLELLTVNETDNEHDQILQAIIYPKKNQFVDYLIEVLTYRLT